MNNNKVEADLRRSACGSDWDCLVDLVSEAETTKSGVDDNPALDIAMNRHVLLCADDDSIELRCYKCPVTCTVKDVGGSAIALIHDREDCIK